MGRRDIRLDEKGLSQAERLANSLSGYELLPVYSSPLTRAYQTADIISSEEVNVRREFKERSFGEWEGLTWDEVYRRNPDLPPEGDSAWLNLRPPGGESNLEMRKRCLEGLEDIRDDGFILVSHSGPLRFIAAELLDIGAETALEKIAFKNAGYLVMESEGSGWEVVESEGVEGV